MNDFPRKDVQMTETCPRCGASRAGPGRFCAQCGAEAFTLPATDASSSTAQHGARPQPTAHRSTRQEVLIPEAWPVDEALFPRRPAWRRAIWPLLIAGIVIAAGVLLATRGGRRSTTAIAAQEQRAGILAAGSAAVPTSVRATGTDSEHDHHAAVAPRPDSAITADSSAPAAHASIRRTPSSPPATPAAAPRKVPTRVAPEPHVPPATPVLTCESAYAQRSWSRAASLCAAAAATGDIGAARLLGQMYDQGLGVGRDPTRAAAWLRRAAEAGSADAARALGVMYESGHGVSRDAGQAIAWYRRGALLGDPGAQLALGRAYENGTGVPRDFGEAFAWLSKAAQQGDAQAQYDVGTMYAAGRGTAQSETDAVRWFRRAAAQGNRDAERELQRRGITP
jgi:hypothetical protein